MLAKASIHSAWPFIPQEILSQRPRFADDASFPLLTDEENGMVGGKKTDESPSWSHCPTVVNSIDLIPKKVES